MGCTSSAPNMGPNQNTTEKKSEFMDDDEAGLSIKDDSVDSTTIEENGVNEIKVLPCDTLGDRIQLDSNNTKSIIDTSDLDTDKGIPTAVDDSISEETKAKENEDVQVKEKLSSLEDVVEKVVELYVTDILSHSIQENPDQSTKIDSITEKASEAEADKISDKIDECESEHSEQILEPPEEALSPSQSTSSRATRWEALADIAAELPPTLTVDPLTGQIYALSK